MESALFLNWIERRARAEALSTILHDLDSRADWSHAIRIRYRLLLIRHQSANGRAGGKITEGKPKFPAINGGGREKNDQPRGLYARSLADVQEICLETPYWLSGRSGWSVVHRVQSARSCAKFCNRSTLPRVIRPLLFNRSFFLSRYSVLQLPRLPSLLLSTPCWAYTRIFLFLRAVAAASAPSSFATQTSINFAGSGPTVFQFRVSTVNASSSR